MQYQTIDNKAAIAGKNFMTAPRAVTPETVSNKCFVCSSIFMLFLSTN